VDILALALHHPRPEIQMDKNVFIVHGHDKSSVSDLETFLKDKRVNPRILGREKRSAQLVLEELENVLRSCHAGFVLITPDDEGRLIARDDDKKGESNKTEEVRPASPAGKNREKLQKRARENVIFETGLLFAKFRQSNRVSVLVKKPVQLPSDLGGMFVDYFESIRDIEDKITTRLTEWGMFDSEQEDISTSMGVQ
jgi:predicted nucleotide-binding protein